MDSPSIADAVVKATPDVAELLDRHARWSAQMCRNVPPVRPETCRNVPSANAPQPIERAGMCQNMPEPARMCHDDENDKTNPSAYNPGPRPLSDRQLAAARLIVRGYGSVEIAAHLGVNRHTVASWKRSPAFVIELQRLRAYLTAAAVAGPIRHSATSASPPRLAPVRMTRAEVAREDAGCEAMIAQILRAKTANRE